MTVSKARVGDVLALQRREVAIDPIKEYELIGIYSFGKGIFHREPTAGGELGDYKFFSIQPGDLVVSNIQAWEGAIGLATGADQGTIGTHRFLSYTPIDDRINTSWARWFFLSEPGMELIQAAAPGSTIRNRTLAVERFEALQIPLPHIDVQRRIAHEIHKAQIRSVGVQVALKGQEAAHILKSLPALVDRTIGRLAEGANPTVETLVDFISDTVHPGDDPSPATSFIGLQHIESNTGRLIGSDPLETTKGRKFRFRSGDILYGYLRPYLNKVWVADRDGLCSVDQYVLRPREGVDPNLIGHILRSRSTLRRVNELTHNLQLPRIRSGLLSTLPVPEVPDHTVNHLTSKLDQLAQTVIALAESRRTQTALANALLPAALNEAFADLT